MIVDIYKMLINIKNFQAFFLQLISLLLIIHTHRMTCKHVPSLVSMQGYTCSPYFVSPLCTLHTFVSCWICGYSWSARALADSHSPLGLTLVQNTSLSKSHRHIKEWLSMCAFHPHTPSSARVALGVP